MDIQAWSWLTKLTPFVEALRPQLRTFRDENGKELFDVPDGLLPDPDTPAPPRFLPTYDNVELGHKDRSRIIGDPARDFVDGKAQWDAVFARGAVLVDGFVSAGWRLERDDKGGPATVVVLPVRRQPFTATERADIEAEARDLLRMAVPERSGTTSGSTLSDRQPSSRTSARNATRSRRASSPPISWSASYWRTSSACDPPDARRSSKPAISGTK